LEKSAVHRKLRIKLFNSTYSRIKKKTYTRYKELIIGAGGENIAPVPIEDWLKSNYPCISNLMMVGDKRKYNTMVVCLKSKGATGISYWKLRIYLKLMIYLKLRIIYVFAVDVLSEILKTLRKILKTSFMIEKNWMLLKEEKSAKNNFPR
jgi:long-subunit acyl-CoA synthetase (AMP-forming)